VVQWNHSLRKRNGCRNIEHGGLARGNGQTIHDFGVDHSRFNEMLPHTRSGSAASPEERQGVDGLAPMDSGNTPDRGGGMKREGDREDGGFSHRFDP
jgi:hypothetical protein